MARIIFQWNRQHPWWDMQSVKNYVTNVDERSHHIFSFDFCLILDRRNFLASLSLSLSLSLLFPYSSDDCRTLCKKGRAIPFGMFSCWWKNFFFALSLSRRVWIPENSEIKSYRAQSILFVRWENILGFCPCKSARICASWSPKPRRK